MTEPAYATKEAASAAPWHSVDSALSSTGQELDTEVRTVMEPLFGGFDFGRTRIHSGGTAAEAAEALGANAFTHGSDIVLGRGADSATLTHELAHVVQHDGAATEESSVDDAEADAAKAAIDVSAGREVTGLAGTADASQIHLEEKKDDPANRLNTKAGATEYVDGRILMFNDEAARVGRNEPMLLTFAQNIPLNRRQFD